jgi:hypothetical protein
MANISTLCIFAWICNDKTQERRFLCSLKSLSAPKLACLSQSRRVATSQTTTTDMMMMN